MLKAFSVLKMHYILAYCILFSMFSGGRYIRTLLTFRDGERRPKNPSYFIFFAPTQLAAVT